jgi:hypothetical protein
MDRRDFAKQLGLGSAVGATLAATPDAAAAMQSGTAAPPARDFDMVVYGGTAGGVATAVSAARQGLKTVLLEPRDHLGGMVTGGLSRTDIGRREVLGGLSLEFYARVGMRYNIKRYNNRVAWFHEPRVGESVFKEMLQEAGVTVLFRHPLREKTGVEKSGGRVRSITCTNGARFNGKVFADCSYEGDLMAQAAVTYTFGREPMSMYNESLAGVRDRTPYHQFMVDIPARAAGGELYPEISAEPVAKPGEGDRKVQAYNFRIIATDDPMNRVPWPKPEGYDPKRYQLLALLLEAMEKKLGRPQVFHELTLIAPIPNRKADFNNQGAFSTDYIGKNYDYPDANYQRRQEIWDDHVCYVQGFYFFLANDPRVPASLQQEVNQWGLCRDEYEDTAHWPHQLYVREARRMVGEYVMRQQDLQTEQSKPDVIGMGSYNSDSHNIQRIVNAKGFVENEGDMQVAVTPYQIAYRMILPKRTECTNLLVPVPFSATHVAYSSLRMEPQYMIIGHAAGVAASLALAANKPVQEIDVKKLQATLLEEGAVFNYVQGPHEKAHQIIRERLRPKGIGRFNWE